jgi:hypothetical protein
VKAGLEEAEPAESGITWRLEPASKLLRMLAGFAENRSSSIANAPKHKFACPAPRVQVKADAMCCFGRDVPRCAAVKADAMCDVRSSPARREGIEKHYHPFAEKDAMCDPRQLLRILGLLQSLVPLKADAIIRAATDQLASTRQNGVRKLAYVSLAP